MGSRIRPIRTALSRRSRPSGPTPCLHSSGHTSRIAGKGKYIYNSEGAISHYIPTPDERFPTVLPPELNKAETKYLQERFKNDPDSICKPDRKFPIPPFECKYMVVERIHMYFMVLALQDYYENHGGQLPCSAYADWLLNR